MNFFFHKKIIKQHINNLYAFYRSNIASELLTTWPAPAKQFVKVFPYEYQRALKQLTTKPVVTVKANGQTNGKSEPIIDIEEAVQDVTFEKKRLEKLLDKTR